MRIAVNGIRLNVETMGFKHSERPAVDPYEPYSGSGPSSPPTLLLLHGFTGSSADWKPFIPMWGEKYRLLMVDIIGHGKSDAPTDPARYTMDHAVADLIGILDHYRVDRCVVLGYSMGGRLALALTVRHPERIRGLILEGSSPGLESIQEREERIRRDEALARRIERGGIESFVSYWENIPLFASQKNLPPSVRAHIRAKRLVNRALGLAHSLRGMGTGAQPSLWHALSDLHMPVLLLAGAWDEKFCRIARNMHKQLPSSEFRKIADAGHNIHVEQAQVFGTMVLDYLSKMI